MTTEVSAMYDASYRIGYLSGQVVIVVGIVALIVWAVRRGRSTARPGVATPDGDLAMLGRILALYLPYDAAVALVGRVLAQSPLIAPVPGPTAAWAVRGDCHLVLALVPGEGCGVLQVAEVEVPLRSPQAAAAWSWVLSAVQAEAAAARIQTTAGERPLGVVRQIGPMSSILGPASA